MYDQLEKIKVEYFEKPSIERNLDYRQIKNGLDHLKDFVEELLKKLSEQNKLGKERE